jgi:hypothetical protein
VLERPPLGPLGSRLEADLQEPAGKIAVRPDVVAGYPEHVVGGQLRHLRESEDASRVRRQRQHPRHTEAGDVGPLANLEDAFDEDPAGYVEFIIDWTSEQISKAKDSGPIRAAVRAVRKEQAVLSDPAGQNMGRYSEMLDRELYRALKALREAQEWRMETSDVLPGDPEPDAAPIEVAEVMGAP